MSLPRHRELRVRLEAFFSAHPRSQISEEGEPVFNLATARFDLEETPGKLLLHLWSAERNWVRRVVGIEEESADCLRLQVERFGRRPGSLLVTEAGAEWAVERGPARRRYCQRLRRLLEKKFPSARVERVSTAADLSRSFSSLCTRARMREGGRWWAVTGVNSGESAAAQESSLTYALIWLDWNRRRYPERVWAGLRLFLPLGQTDRVAQRLVYLTGSRLEVELYAMDERKFAFERVDQRDVGNLDTYLLPARHVRQILEREGLAVRRIRALAPKAIQAGVPAGRNEVVLRFHGLEFARCSRGRVSFGVEGEEQPLTEENFPALAALVGRLRRERSAQGAPGSPYYRAEPERWLESLLRARPSLLDPRLNTRWLYPQVPAVAAGERGLADLLGVTRDGRLVVIELKASSDIHLPLQGLDYWLRVRWHQARGELKRSGYFAGVGLKPDPPELLLVSPALQFHPTTEALLGYLAPEIPATLVGINEDWRRRPKVVFRRRRPNGSEKKKGGSAPNS